MVKHIYIDTSVIAGYYDEEFEYWTKIFFYAVDQGKFKIVVSDLLIQELQDAHDFIRKFLDKISEDHKTYIELSEESEALAESLFK